MPDVRLPDGTVVKNVPDGMTQAELLKRLGRETPIQTEPLPGPPNVFERLGGVADVGLTLGSGVLGELAGGLAASPIPLGQPARQVPGGGTLTPQEQVFESVSSRFQRPPKTEVGQQILSRISPALESVDTGITDVFGKVPGPPEVKAAARTIPEAALAVLGLRGLGSAGRATKAALSPVVADAGTFIPKIKDLFNAGRVAFNEARIQGGGIKPQALDRAVGKIRGLKNEGGLRIDFDPDIHPEAFKVRQRLLNDLDTGQVDFDELMTLRELAADVAGSSESKIAFRGMKLRNTIDDFVDSLGPNDVISGNPERAAQSLKSARQFWRDASAARTIEREMNLAGINANTYSGAGYENALRTQFKQLSRRIEKGQEKGFKPDEVAAIKLVANGGPFENIARAIGKLAPTGVVSGGAGAGIGFLLGGAPGAVALPATGAIGRQLATRATINNAQRALELPLSRSLLTP